MEITEKTQISLFAILASLPFITGAIIWLSTIDSKASAAQDEIKYMRVVVQDIRDTLIRIEERIKKQGR